MFDFLSLMCAMRCEDAGFACNLFRIESGICTFGFMSPASDYDASEDSGIEVFIKSIFHISLLLYDS